jgi:hypothetical protein
MMVMVMVMLVMRVKLREIEGRTTKTISAKCLSFLPLRSHLSLSTYLPSCCPLLFCISGLAPPVRTVKKEEQA